jgi:type IV pilus assembly protein PilV
MMMKPHHHRQSGSTLIEALIALVVFAIGMVGIAGLMSAGIKYQTGNEARLNVSAALNDMSERIRVNVAGANGYTGVVNGVAATGTGYQLAATYADQVAAASQLPNPNCLSADCTPAELATYDVTTWRTLLKATLPGGAGYITGDVTKGFIVSVMWMDKNAVNADDSLQTATNLTCSTAAADQTLAKTRFCCPDGAAPKPGVRCYTAKVIP